MVFAPTSVSPTDLTVAPVRNIMHAWSWLLSGEPEAGSKNSLGLKDMEETCNARFGILEDGWWQRLILVSALITISF